MLKFKGKSVLTKGSKAKILRNEEEHVIKIWTTVEVIRSSYSHKLKRLDYYVKHNGCISIVGGRDLIDWV